MIPTDEEMMEMKMEMEEKQNKEKRSKFIGKVNALTPLVTLGAGVLCIVLATFNPELWEKDGFIITLGALIGNSATGAYTQKDEN